ncbi:MAG: TonB-dependent receptor [Pseudomonadota bacterium]
MANTRKWLIATMIAAVSLQTSAAELEEMIVTAQKRAENIQDVPISISAYGASFLEDSGIRDLQQLGYYAPNLNLSQSSQVANQRILIRGVGSVANNALEPSVAVFIDGVYYPRPGALVGKLQDISSVEVLRGPQGTLFGRNASVGALNIATSIPDATPLTELSLGAGDFGAVSGSLLWNGAISDGTAARVSVQYDDRDGTGDNLLDGNTIGARTDLGVRAALAFEPMDQMQAVLRFDYKDIENNGLLIDVVPDSVLPAYVQTLSFIQDDDLSNGINGPLPDITDAFDHQVNQVHEDTASDEQWGASLDVIWPMWQHTVRSITAYRSWENNSFESALRLPTDLLDRVTQYETTTFSQEYQLLSEFDGPLQYVAGVYFYDEDYDVDQALSLGQDFCPVAVFNQVFNQVLTATGDAALATGQATGTAGLCAAGAQDRAIDSVFRQSVQSFAVFSQITYDLSDTLTAIFGLRYTDDDKEGDFDVVINNVITGPAGLNLRVPETADLAFSDSAVTWLANLSWDVSDNTMAFITASTGYKGGGFNSESTGRDLSAAGLRQYRSEDVSSLEVGFKSTLSRAATLNASLFRTDIDDFQDRAFDGLSFTVINAGELRQQGLEVDTNWQMSEHWRLIAGAAWLDSEFLSYPNATNLPGFIPTTPTQDLAGARNNWSPELQYSLVLDWRTQARNLEWFARGEYQYTDDQNPSGSTDNNPRVIQEGYGLMNFRVGVAATDDRWRLALSIRNLSDEGYCQNMFYQPLNSTLGLLDPASGHSMLRCVVGDPRTAQLQARWSL